MIVKTDAKKHSAGTNCSVSSLLPGAPHWPELQTTVSEEKLDPVGGINHLNN